MRTRDFRRHHTARLKNARKHYKGGWAGDSSRNLGLVFTSPATCSCWMCGNERKHFKKPTVQEISDAKIIAKELI